MDGPILKYRKKVGAGALSADPCQELAAEQLQMLHNRLANLSQTPLRGLKDFLSGKNKEPVPRGLYLYGDVGRGKSMLMDLFFDGAPVEKKRRVHFHAFMQEVHRAIHAWRQMTVAVRRRHPDYVREAADDPIRPVAKGIAQQARLLCFDEFQVTDITDAMILGRLFEALFCQGVVVVATSNRAPDALYEDGLNRQLFTPFIDLIKERMDVLHLEGRRDHRLNLGGGLQVYHAPLGPAADAGLDAAWAEITGSASECSEDLPVQGRLVTVARAAGGAARFSYSDLAERPLAAADFLAIAARYHTILIDCIPVMDKTRRNEAKRFVTLIDALYEARVKVICSAAAAPRALHPSGAGAFEFARTASRLIEMQSAAYLAADHVRSEDLRTLQLS